MHYKEYFRKKREEEAASLSKDFAQTSSEAGVWREYFRDKQDSSSRTEYNPEAQQFLTALQNRPKVQVTSTPKTATPSATAAKPYEDGDLFSLLGNAFMGGINQVNDAWVSAADFLFGRPLAALGWEDNPISALNEYYSGLNEAYSRAALEEAEKLGGGWKTTATQLGMSAVAALPDAAFALMTGGTSLGGKAAATAAGSTADLVGDTVMQMAKNPQYWSAFAREVGLNYEEAKADGGSEFVASTAALLTSLVNAGIEIGPDSTSGIQGLSEALKDGSKTRLRKVLESAVDEGKEEVLQGIVSRATSNALLGKNAYWVSFDPENQDAIINPVTMATEFGGGLVVGGLLSGGALGADYALRKATGQSVAPVEAAENPNAGFFTEMEPEADLTADEYTQMLANSQAETEEPALEFEAAEPVQTDAQAEGPAIRDDSPEAEIERFAQTFGNQAEAVRSTYISGQDAYGFEEGYRAAYEYGKSGATLEAAKASPSVTGMTEMQIEAAYGAGRSAVQAPAKKVGVVRNEYLLNASDADIEYMDALAKASGTQIEIVAPTGDGGVNGWYKDGVIAISSDAQDSYAVVASHEVTHRLKEIAPAEYRRYQDYVMQIKTRGGDASALVAETQERYAKAGQTLSEDEAREEIAANFTRDLMRDVDRFYELVDADRSIATRLLDSLKAFLKKVKNVWNGSKAKQDAAAMKAYGVGMDELEKATKLWGDALKSGSKQKNAAQTSSKTRYAIQYDQNNRPYVVIDRDILAGVPQSGWVKTVKEKLKERFPDGVRIGRNVISINSQSRSEMTYSGYMRRLLSQDPDLYSDKLRATDNLDEILKASREYVNEALHHPRKDDVQEFARGNVLLDIGGKEYSADVVVAMRRNGNLLMYDILNLKGTSINKKTGHSKVKAENPPSGTDSQAVSDEKNIPQPERKVKARFSLKEPAAEPNVRKTDAGIVDEVDPETISDEKTRNAVRRVKPVIEAQRKAKADLDTAWAAYKSGVQSMPKAERATLKRQLDRLQAAALEAEGKTNAALRSPELQKVIVTERSRIYRALLEEYGAHKPGENAAREVKVPKKTAPNEAVGRFARTAMETESAGEELRGELEREIASGTFSHVVESDKEAVQYAQRMKERGIAEKEWDSVVNGRVVADKNQIAVGEMLFLEAAEAGDTKRAVQLCVELCAEATRAGRTLQAVRLLKKMGGAGQLYAIERQVENLQKDLDKRHGITKAPVLKIDENLADLLVKAKTEQERERVKDMILADVANQTPVRWLDKWNAWRYLAMLGNPRTHIRNLVGNGVFVPVVFMKNAVGAGVEFLAQRSGKLQQSERTKTVSVSKEYRDFAKADVEKVKDLLTGDTKEGFSDDIRKKQQIFKTKALETLRVKNSKALENEDYIFKSIHYRHALAQILAARKLDVSTLTPDNPSGYTQLLSARTAALKEAERATFQDASAFAAALNRFSKTNAGTAFVTEAVLPFKKTPVNILKRGVEYSPIGLTISIGKMAKQLRDGDVTADVLNDFAAGLTGTAVLALGTFLASQGILKGGYDDEREGEFDELVGGQEYALQFDDHTFTIDWAAPIALPLFVGAEVWNAINGEYENLSFSVFANALTGITEPMFNLSMLDGLNDTLSSVANADNGQELTTFAREIVTGYLGQAVPTFFGQIARSTDEVRRRTYIDKNSEVPQWAQYFIQQQMNKIPGLSGYQQPYVDAWGRQDSPENWVEAGERALENFALPGYFSSYEVSAMEEELMRVHEATGADVFPKYAQKYFTANNQRLDLTAEQYTKFQTEMGQTSYNLMTALTQSSGYRSMSDDYKAEAIGKIYTFAREKAKRTLVREYDMIKDAYKYEITTGWMEELVNKTDRTVVNAILEKTKESMKKKEE